LTDIPLNAFAAEQDTDLLGSKVRKARVNSTQCENQYMNVNKYDDLRREELIRLLESRDAEEAGGIRLAYKGQTPPWQIVRQVKPRRQKIEKKLSVGSEDDQACNLIVEGENLQAMVSLYKYRGQIDLIIADPPYNTGQDFRYNDRWDTDPNDPDLGKLVPADDGSRHTKWLRFMTPRLWMMKEMLKPGGVLAICIDHRELFRLGMLLDQVFSENQLGIINWQKAFSPKNDSTHLSTATEYVLIYAKSAKKASTARLPRDEKSDRFFANPDNDPEGEWAGKDPTAKEFRRNTIFGIQSPFTGMLHYPDFEYRFDGKAFPEATKHWTGMTRAEMKRHLEAWGVAYKEKDLGDGRGPALVLADSAINLKGYHPETDPVVTAAKREAFARLQNTLQPKPKLYFRDDKSRGTALGRPRIKNYLKHVQRGKVPLTYWADEDYDTPLILGPQSWNHSESGHSQAGVNELDALMGKGHGFQTVKPLKLIKKIIHLWCPPSGIVFDPFAGSGTTGHAALQLNKETGARRRFLLVEQGRRERGDAYARTLTSERVRRAILGERPNNNGDLVVADEGLGGGFRFTQLTKAVDADAVLALEREEMLDLLLTSHWDQTERGAAHLKRLPAEPGTYLFAVGGRGEGYFLVWSGPDNPSVLNRDAFRKIAEEARAAGLNPPYHVYARTCTYSGPNIEFYQIPNKILDKLGFNEATEPFSCSQEALV
jgi:adenine-specific DNA-methyltransferase